MAYLSSAMVAELAQAYALMALWKCGKSKKESMYHPLKARVADYVAFV